jgi:hypothetical protein
VWYQLAAACVGLWLMAAPAALEIDRPAATIAWIVGPLVASFAAVAMWGATRPLRWANLPLALWLVLAPAILPHSPSAAASSVACGIAIAVLSAFRGSLRHRYGGGWSSLWRGDTRECAHPVGAPHTP